MKPGRFSSVVATLEVVLVVVILVVLFVMSCELLVIHEVFRVNPVILYVEMFRNERMSLLVLMQGFDALQADVITGPSPETTVGSRVIGS